MCVFVCLHACLHACVRAWGRHQCRCVWGIRQGGGGSPPPPPGLPGPAHAHPHLATQVQHMPAWSCIGHRHHVLQTTTTGQLGRNKSNGSGSGSSLQESKQAKQVRGALLLKAHTGALILKAHTGALIIKAHTGALIIKAHTGALLLKATLVH